MTSYDDANLDEKNAVKNLFLEAIDIQSAVARAAFLDIACKGEDRIRRHVEALLKAHDQPDLLLDLPVVQSLSESLRISSDMEKEAIGLLGPTRRDDSQGRLDHYEFLELVGHGSMGVVFRAFDEKLKRIVAIKMLAPILSGSGPARGQFVQEARAAAAVAHEHVIAIHAVEESGPVPYLVMQYVNGKTLQMKIDDSSPLSLVSILRTGAQIAEGLAAAHRQGLVHRDIKPANILLENGVERVKITDFGLAYAMDDAGASQGSTAGTPVFMSPEQASGERLDQRSDLFSFGSVLYTMCAGRPPFDSGSLLSVIQKITQDAPRRVREVNPSTPEWLAAIVERLMEKKPDRRIQTASEVAAMLQSRLNDLELSTRGNALPKSSAPLRKRLAKWAMVFALAAAAVPIVIHYMHGSAGSAKQNDLMKLPPEIKPIIPLRVMSMPDSLELAKRPAAADALDRNMIPPELLDAGGWDKLTDAPPELVAILGKPIQNQYCQIFSLAVSPDGKIVAVAGVDKVIRIWDIAAGKLQKELFGHQKTGGIAVYSLAFNPEGNLLASGDEQGFVKLWDIAAGREVASVNSPSDRITQLAFSPDGKLLLVCHQHGTINHWNIPAMTLHFAMKTPAEPWSVAISPDGQTWAYGDNQKVFFYDLLTGKLKGNLPYEPATVRWIGFRPDGQIMVTAAMDPQKSLMLRVWDFRNLREIAQLEGHTQAVLTGAWRTDGKLLATAGQTDGTVILWDMTTKAPRHKVLPLVRPNLQWVDAMAFSPEGRYLIVGHPDGMIFILRLAKRGEVFQIR